jgi:hypothetical protein
MIPRYGCIHDDLHRAITPRSYYSLNHPEWYGQPRGLPLEECDDSREAEPQALEHTSLVYICLS